MNEKKVRLEGDEMRFGIHRKKNCPEKAKYYNGAGGNRQTGDGAEEGRNEMCVYGLVTKLIFFCLNCQTNERNDDQMALI